MNLDILTAVKEFASIIYTLLMIYVAWRLSQVEKNTNSMKDAMVLSAKKEGASEEKAAAIVREAEDIVDAENKKSS